MSVEADLAQALGPLVDGRVYPDTPPAGVALPFIVYQQVGGDPLNFMEGVADKKNGRFQIEVWSAYRHEASDIARRAEDVICTDPALLGTVLNGMLATYDDTLNWYGALQDFSVWF